VMDQQEFREWMVNQGIEPMYGGPVEFRALIVSEIDRLGKIVKLSGAQLE
jgi:tripartite-type tricarboxylate transporter receptor subunit TctC